MPVYSFELPYICCDVNSKNLLRMCYVSVLITLYDYKIADRNNLKRVDSFWPISVEGSAHVTEPEQNVMTVVFCYEQAISP